MAFEAKFDLGFKITLNYRTIYVHTVSNNFFGNLWGHGGLQMASTASEVKFEISNLIYPAIHVQVTSYSHFGGLLGCGGLQMTSEASCDLRFQLCGLNYLLCHIFLASKGFCELN